MLLCENCKIEFIPNNKKPTQRFCSKICKDIARDKRRNKNPEYKIKINKRYKERYAKKYNDKKVKSGENTFWKINMRCNNPKYHGYKYYGGKGIQNKLTKE